MLVDRLWPRGVLKESLRLDQWNRHLAPSAGLRRWFAHDEAKWEAFQRRYIIEMDAPEPRADIARLRDVSAVRPLLLLYAARAERRNHAVLLRELLLGKNT